MTFETATDAAQSATQAAARAIARAVPREGRGHINAAAAALEDAEQELRAALAQIEYARAMLAANA